MRINTVLRNCSGLSHRIFRTYCGICKTNNEITLTFIVCYNDICSLRPCIGKQSLFVLWSIQQNIRTYAVFVERRICESWMCYNVYEQSCWLTSSTSCPVTRGHPYFALILGSWTRVLALVQLIHDILRRLKLTDWMETLWHSPEGIKNLFWVAGLSRNMENPILRQQAKFMSHI